MKIVLIRHGKPIIPPLNWMSASSFGDWVKDYSISGLSISSKPTPTALNYARDCNAIVCSNLPRSIDSGHVLETEKIILSDSIFNEVEIPSANWHRLKLSPNLWAVLFRSTWLLGYSRNTESFTDIKTRAADAFKLLSGIAYEREKVVFVGHAVFNQFLARELRKNGWKGPRNPGTRYWSHGVYRARNTGRKEIKSS
jgi:hypothetical protein